MRCKMMHNAFRPICGHLFFLCTTYVHGLSFITSLPVGDA